MTSYIEQPPTDFFFNREIAKSKSRFQQRDLLPLIWNGDIMRNLGQNMTIFELRHFILTFRRSSEVNDLDRPHTYLVAEWLVLGVS